MTNPGQSHFHRSNSCPFDSHELGLSLSLHNSSTSASHPSLYVSNGLIYIRDPSKSDDEIVTLEDEKAKEVIVTEQTESVVRNFMMASYELDQQNAAENIPSLVEFKTFSEEALSYTGMLGRKLAVIGDTIEDKYGSDLNNLLSQLTITPSNGYRVFQMVAQDDIKKVFQNGISWGRLIIFFKFGYKMAIKLFQLGVRGFFSEVVSHIVKIIVCERITTWIANQGGWLAALQAFTESQSTTQMFVISAFMALTMVIVFGFIR